jgi:hypothetical protein
VSAEFTVGDFWVVMHPCPPDQTTVLVYLRRSGEWYDYVGSTQVGWPTTPERAMEVAKIAIDSTQSGGEVCMRWW